MSVLVAGVLKSQCMMISTAPDCVCVCVGGGGGGGGLGGGGGGERDKVIC